MNQRVSYTVAHPVLFGRDWGGMLKINGIRVVLVSFILWGNVTIIFSPSTLWNWIITFHFNYKMAQKIHKPQPKNTLSASGRYYRNDLLLYAIWSPDRLYAPRII